jgi:hypothetical protein
MPAIPATWEVEISRKIVVQDQPWQKLKETLLIS